MNWTEKTDAKVEAARGSELKSRFQTERSISDH